jgi:putative FmdB family regulatory protein
MALEPDINLCTVRIGKDWGGLAFVVIAMSIIVGGLASARWFFLASLAGGAAVSVAVAWRTRHPARRFWRPLTLGLRDASTSQAGDEVMPIYEYECGACNHRFSETLSLRELEHHKAQCPQCKSENVQRVLSQVSVKTSRKS